MPRANALLSVAVVALLGLVALGAQPGAAAQEGTPPPADGIDAGITYDPVAFAVGVDLPDAADVVVVRIGLEPGAGFPLEASDPTPGMLLVEEGAFTVRVDAPLSVTRGAGLDDALATAEATGDLSATTEEIAAGEELTLAAGDAAFIPGGISGEIRNDGQERAVALGFLLPPSAGGMAEATPAP